MVGSKVYGDLSNSPSADVAVSYAYKYMVYSCTGYDLFKKADLTVMYDYDKNTRFSAICRVFFAERHARVRPGRGDEDGEGRGGALQGVQHGRSVRVLQGDRGEEGRLPRDRWTVDAANLSNGNHRTGAGIEFHLFECLMVTLLFTRSFEWASYRIFSLLELPALERRRSRT